MGMSWDDAKKDGLEDFFVGTMLSELKDVKALAAELEERNSYLEKLHAGAAGREEHVVTLEEKAAKLEAQRNEAIDNSVELSGVIAARNEEIERLEAELCKSKQQTKDVAGNATYWRTAFTTGGGVIVDSAGKSELRQESKRLEAALDANSEEIVRQGVIIADRDKATTALAEADEALAEIYHMTRDILDTHNGESPKHPMTVVSDIRHISKTLRYHKAVKSDGGKTLGELLFGERIRHNQSWRWNVVEERLAVELKRVSTERDNLKNENTKLRAIRDEEWAIVTNAGPISCRNGAAHTPIDACLYCIIETTITERDELKALLPDFKHDNICQPCEYHGKKAAESAAEQANLIKSYNLCYENYTKVLAGDGRENLDLYSRIKIMSVELKEANEEIERLKSNSGS